MSATDHTGGGSEEGQPTTVQPGDTVQPQWAAADSGTQVFSATPGTPQPYEGGNTPEEPYRDGYAEHGSPGDYAAEGPGGGYTPPPPHEPHAAGWGPPPGGGGGRGKVLLIAAVTALVTSLVVGPAATLLTMYLIGSWPPFDALDGQTSSRSTGDVSEVADKALPSVVSIQAGTGAGSGVIISSNGQILTNAHVVTAAEGDQPVRVQFNNGEEADAEVLGADPVSDLAVLRAEGQSGLTPAVFGDSDKVEVGADIVAIGSPLGLSGTVTSGVVSALDRPVNTGVVDPEQPEDNEGEQPPIPGFPDEEPDQEGSEPQAQTTRVINAIQSDAPINPGNSGGPLMNMNGEVIGINTAIAGTGGQMGGESGSIGLGFAIPANQARPIAEQLVEHGEANYAAIDATITGTEDGSGAEIVETSENGAAEQAGLEDGDIITAINDKKISSPDELIATVRSYQPNDTLTVSYERGRATDEAEVTLSAQSAESIGE